MLEICQDLQWFQSIAAQLPCSKVEISFSTVFSAALIILSSAKFNKSVFDIQRYRSLTCWIKVAKVLNLEEAQVIEFGKHYVY